MTDAKPLGEGAVFGFVQRELDRIAIALRRAPNPECYARLYAAQQALSWALEPDGFKSPYEAITGIPANSADCLAYQSPLSSEGTHSQIDS